MMLVTQWKKVLLVKQGQMDKFCQGFSLQVGWFCVDILCSFYRE